MQSLIKLICVVCVCGENQVKCGLNMYAHVSRVCLVGAQSEKKQLWLHYQNLLTQALLTK